MIKSNWRKHVYPLYSVVKSPDWREYVYPVLRKHWHAIKGVPRMYWNDRWMYFKVIILFLAVEILSRVFGHYSIYIW